METTNKRAKEMTTYPMGLKFRRTIGRKNNSVETLVDILTTTNLNNKVVKICYVSEQTVMGQIVRNYDVPRATISRAEKIND